jgi:hypothetical protein
MELIENDIPRKRIIIHIVSTKNIYSTPVPANWTAKKLKSFLKVAFKDQVNEGLALFHEGKKLSDEFKLDTIMSEDSETFPKILVINSNVVSGEKDALDPKRINEIVNTT